MSAPHVYSVLVSKSDPVAAADAVFDMSAQMMHAYIATLGDNRKAIAQFVGTFAAQLVGALQAELGADATAALLDTFKSVVQAPQSEMH